MSPAVALAELGIVVAAAAALCAGLVVLLRPLLQRYALARPNARSSHTEPTPQGGGIAVVAATLAIATAACFFGGTGMAPLATVVAATAAMAAIGAIDDIRPMGVVPRLLGQAVLVAVVLATLPAEYRLMAPLPWWCERVLFLIAGVWFVNLYNFMDGIDWMTVAETVPVAAALALLGLAGGQPFHATVTAAALAGAMLGFAPFNRPVAKLFLGDVGSLPIGLLLGWLLALLAVRGDLAAAALLPLYYLADATMTLVRRIAKGERPWESHRTHFYQRATAAGFSVRAVVARVFAVNLALAALAATTVYAGSRAVDIAALAAGAALVGWLLAAFARGRR